MNSTKNNKENNYDMHKLDKLNTAKAPISNMILPKLKT